MTAAELYLQGWVTLVAALLVGAYFGVRAWHDRVAPRIVRWRHQRRDDRTWS